MRSSGNSISREYVICVWLFEEQIELESRSRIGDFDILQGLQQCKFTVAVVSTAEVRVVKRAPDCDKISGQSLVAKVELDLQLTFYASKTLSGFHIGVLGQLSNSDLSSSVSNDPFQPDVRYQFQALQRTNAEQNRDYKWLHSHADNPESHGVLQPRS